MAKHSDAPFYLQFPADVLIRETEKAKCLLVDDEQVWIPKSQILHEEIRDGILNLTLPEWLVISKGLELYYDQEWDSYGRPD